MKSFFPKILFSILLALIKPTFSHAQESSLAVADSLFASGKYTDAIELYDQIFNEGKVSEAMLLRMAFIEEGLGNYAKALYLLNVYYKQTADENALIKIAEIADEHNLYGYSQSDYRFFIDLIYKYQWEILGVLGAFSILLLSISYRQKKNDHTPVTSIILNLVILVLIGALINGLLFSSSAIITNDHVVLMSGPSAGAEPVEVIDRGHRVEVIDHGTIWNQIEWNGQRVYVRSKNLQLL